MSTLRTKEEKMVWNSPEKLTVIKIKVILKKFNIQFNSKHLQAMLVELYIDLASQQCPEIASSWKSKSMPVSTQSPSPYARSNLNVCRELLQGWLLQLCLCRIFTQPQRGSTFANSKAY
ncbi:hypothetical protein BY996DRAFT_6423106 [Phakopsora pachyrhizi]|nr:hypothetical protein BY996DRAFT_6423106 [Phakopsora pachyrhizi]